MSTGYTGEPAEFAVLNRQLRVWEPNVDYAALSLDSSPIVRAVGLIGLAKLGAHKSIRMHITDATRIVLGEGGCIWRTTTMGEFAKGLLDGSLRPSTFG